MKLIDIVILSNAKTDELRQTTQNCIDSIYASGEDIFNVIVIEGTGGVAYEKTTTCHLEEPFNYNGFVNYGILNFGKCDYHLWCNNDVIFTENSIHDMLNLMQKYNADSCSPNCMNTFGYKLQPEAVRGYQVRKHVNGWCILCTKEAFRKIGYLNEDFDFWFADNVYSWQLEQAGLSHYLFTDVFVNHLNPSGTDGLTFKTLDNDLKDKYTYSQFEHFKKYYKPKMTSELAKTIINQFYEERMSEAINYIVREEKNKLELLKQAKKSIVEILDINKVELKASGIISAKYLKEFLEKNPDTDLRVSLNEFEVVNV